MCAKWQNGMEYGHSCTLPHTSILQENCYENTPSFMEITRSSCELSVTCLLPLSKIVKLRLRTNQKLPIKGGITDVSPSNGHLIWWNSKVLMLDYRIWEKFLFHWSWQGHYSVEPRTWDPGTRDPGTLGPKLACTERVCTGVSNHWSSGTGYIVFRKMSNIIFHSNT